LFEFFVGDEGFVFDAGLVGIDGIDGIFEDTSYFLIFMDAHADEGEDAKVRIQEFLVF
jgi:hypothetical protein